MTCSFRGPAKILGTLTLAGTLALIAIMPAAAASPNATHAAGATGLITAAPIGLAAFPGTSPVSLANADIAGLLTTGTVTDQAAATSASSIINNAAAKLTAAALTTPVSLSAIAVSSTCTFDTNTGKVSGSAATAHGVITWPSSTVTLAANPAPNTVVAGLAGVAKVTLNAQSTAGDGTLTVTAIQISMIGSNQSLSLGVSVCNASNLAPVPILPGRTLPVTLGAAGVLGLAGAGLRLRRAGKAVTRALPRESTAVQR